MDSDKFAEEKLGGSKVGAINVDKMNTKGGSLSIGHPFGATGSRLVTTASRRLQQEEERFALVAACADGGLGHACLLERYDA
jgi:acetyl-CoA acyltransferase